ncbi:MAG: hypothetical protein OHK0046_07200 [Anaerolineae bacterium]
MTETASQQNQESSGSFRRNMILAGVALAVVILLPLIIGLLFAVLAPPEPTAQRFGMLRDIFIIILSLQGVLVIAALVILILQVTRLVALIQAEVTPILENTKDTVETARGTAQFVGKNAASPIISAQAFLAGAFVFAREFGGIRRAIRPDRKREGKRIADDAA